MFNIQYSLFCCLELNSLVAHLDNKIKKKESANRYRFQRKSRVESTPSTSNPPQKAPLWTINSESCSRDVVMESSSLTESPSNTATQSPTVSSLHTPTQSPTLSSLHTPTRTIRISNTPVRPSLERSNWKQSRTLVSSPMPVQSQPSPLTSTPLSKTHIASRKTAQQKNNVHLDDIMDNETISTNGNLT